LLADQPRADLLLDVELKACDDHDAKVYLDGAGRLRTISPAALEGPVLGAMTGLLRCSAAGSGQFFAALDECLARPGVLGPLAELLCHLHKRMELRFHLSPAHHRVVPIPRDAVPAQELHAQDRRSTRRAA
jgi:hypothetical protein